MISPAKTNDVVAPPKGKRSRGVLYALLAVLVAVSALWWQTRRQRLDGALSDAVLQSDAARVLELLASGADPNARLQTPGAFGRLSFADWLRSWLHGGPPRPDVNRQTMLMLAASASNAEIVRALLDAGADPNVRLPNGKTAILAARGSHSDEIVKLLVAKHADLAVQDESGATPVMRAVLNNSAGSLATLLDAGGSPDMADRGGRTPLIAAAEMRRAGLVDLLLAHGAKLPAELPPMPARPAGLLSGGPGVGMGATPAPPGPGGPGSRVTLAVRAPAAAPRVPRWPSLLQWAASSGSAALIDAVWKVEGKAQGGFAVVCEQAMNEAISSHSTGAIQALLNHGVPIEQAFSAASTRTIWMNTGQVAVPIQFVPTAPSALATAVATGDEATVNFVLAHGARVNFPNGVNAQPLIVAAGSSRSEAMVRLLLHRGADVNLTDGTGATALLRARSPEVVRMLLAHGAKPSAADNAGATALHFCDNISPGAKPGEVAELLVAAGADVNAVDKAGKTPLHACSWNGTADLLLRHGAAIDAVDSRGMTPLMAAVERFNPPKVELLLKRGANVRHADVQGFTAMDLATRSKNAQLIALLEQYHAPHGRHYVEGVGLPARRP